jgi:adenine C2-methylase RlmN of 23S rRNA A2503 and tRNA A37
MYTRSICWQYGVLNFQLVSFFQVVNLIPYNPATTSDFKATSQEDLTTFQKILRGQYGIRTTIRQEMGQDIAGACGQLVVSQSVKQTPKVTDIEELCKA